MISNSRAPTKRAGKDKWGRTGGGTNGVIFLVVCFLETNDGENEEGIECIGGTLSPVVWMI